MMYMFGQGTRQNLPEGARWLKGSANGGLPHAMVALAGLYDVGQGVPFDPAQALQLRQKAARLGNPTAQGQLDDDRRLRGQADFRRASILTDLQLYAEALPYARRAAAAGSANAEFLLGRACHFGLGTPVSLPEAVRWYRTSSEAGLADASRGLAYMYEFGLGVRADRAMALKYYDKAAAGGSDLARRAAANLRSPDYDQPRNYSAGGGSTGGRCSGGYSFDYASGSCSPMVPGLSPYNP
jgi:TPR repeat protein